MDNLFDGDSDTDLQLKTDTDYAKNYNRWRKKEELHKLQARYGEISSSSDSSSSEEDEDEQPGGIFDTDFLKTLSLLKTKDSRIYDKTFDFFKNAKESGASKLNVKREKDQPMYLKDYERKMVLERGGQFSDEDDDENDIKPKPFTYKDEQNELKENFKMALDNIRDEEDDGDGEEWGSLFKTRMKTDEEKETEEDDYLQWLAGQSKTLNDEEVESELKSLKQFWSDPKLDADEKFLRDYVLKKRFLETEDADYVPTYEEIVHDSDKDFSEDERAIDKQEEFEYKYNFRFEEPDQEFIKRYPRTMENSLRQTDDKRKAQRLERKERKAVEKKQKMEDINKLKEMKRQEIREKISQLKEITGNSEIGFDVNDFEDDFDPDEHDKRMQSLFNEEFYQGHEGDQKPEFPDLDEELELENWDRWHGVENNDNPENGDQEEHQPHCEDENFIMDCDYGAATTQQELINNSKRKKRKRKSQFAKVLSKPKPVFDPKDRTYQEHLDEYYKLDCEDVIGDVPCRFKYRRVIPNDFGLSVEEILAAKDKELNRWCSLKKALQYRPEHVEKYDLIAFAKKAENVNLKKKYLPSLFELETNNIDTDIVASSDNTTEIVHLKKHNDSIGSAPNLKEESSIQAVTVDGSENSISKKKKVDTTSQNNAIQDPAENRNLVVNDGINRTSTKKKKKKKAKKSAKCDTISSTNETVHIETNLSNKKKHKQDSLSENVRKQKKRKQGSFHSSRSKVKEPEQDIGISDARLAAYGLKPKKFKNKLKYGNIK